MRTVRIAALPVALTLLVGLLAGCTQEIAGTPGPRPTVSGGGDFPSGSGSGSSGSSGSSDGSSGSSSDASPTDTASPTDDSTPSEDGSVSQLCADMTDTISGPDLGDPEFYKSLIGLDILGWGIANQDSDPFSSVDAATTTTCPDVRTAVLAKIGTPDLKSVDS